MQRAVTHECVPNTSTRRCFTTCNAQGSACVGCTTGRTCSHSIALQCNCVVARVIHWNHACKVTRTVVLVGLVIVVGCSCVCTTEDDTSCRELELTTSALIVCPNQEVIICIGLEVWQEALHRTCARSSHVATYKWTEVVTSVTAQHCKPNTFVGDVSRVEEERVVVRAVECEVHTVSSSCTLPRHEDFFCVGTTKVTREGFSCHLGSGSCTLIIGR